VIDEGSSEKESRKKGPEKDRPSRPKERLKSEQGEFERDLDADAESKVHRGNIGTSGAGPHLLGRPLPAKARPLLKL
jgi:hypothetical protein